jgi:hypothetical protein
VRLTNKAHADGAQEGERVPSYAWRNAEHYDSEPRQERECLAPGLDRFAASMFGVHDEVTLNRALVDWIEQERTAQRISPPNRVRAFEV